MSTAFPLQTHNQTIKAKAELQQVEKQRKEVQKMKDSGKAVLSLITVPLAKFETDLAVLRGCDSTCPLLPTLSEILDMGVDYKRQATDALHNGEQMATKLDMMKSWLNSVRANGKAMQALIKGAAK